MAYTTGHELLLNACEGVLQMVLSHNEQTLCFQEYFQIRRATELLAPALAEMLAHCDITPAHLRRIGCFTGPGSFTGIRLVLATAAALRRCTQAQLAGLDYLQALATSAVIRRGWLYPGRVCVITHARQEQVHWQVFTSYGPQIPAVSNGPTELISPEHALERIGPEPCLVCGSGLRRHLDIFSTPITGQGPAGAPQAVLMPELINPDLAALNLLGRHGDYFPTDLEPKYVRGCDAVEELERKGDEEAVAALHARLAQCARSQ